MGRPPGAGHRTGACYAAQGNIPGLHQQLFAVSPREGWLPVAEELAAELRERLARLGYEGGLALALGRWAGVESLERRIDSADEVDPVVLQALREASS